MKRISKVIPALLILAALLVALGSALAFAVETDDGYVWVVRTYQLQESDFTANTTTLNFNFTLPHNGSDTALADIDIPSMSVYCDDTLASGRALPPPPTSAPPPPLPLQREITR